METAAPKQGDYGGFNDIKLQPGFFSAEHVSGKHG
jgi:hypothetical protein